MCRARDAGQCGAVPVLGQRQGAAVGREVVADPDAVPRARARHRVEPQESGIGDRRGGDERPAVAVPPLGEHRRTDRAAHGALADGEAEGRAGARDAVEVRVARRAWENGVRRDRPRLAVPPLDERLGDLRRCVELAADGEAIRRGLCTTRRTASRSSSRRDWGWRRSTRRSRSIARPRSRRRRCRSIVRRPPCRTSRWCTTPRGTGPMSRMRRRPVRGMCSPVRPGPAPRPSRRAVLGGNGAGHRCPWSKCAALSVKLPGPMVCISNHRRRCGGYALLEKSRRETMRSWWARNR